MSEAVSVQGSDETEMFELISCLRRKRGRPRKLGLLLDEIPAALHGLLGLEAQGLARILLWLDVNLQGGVPRVCECGGPLRYRLDPVRPLLRLYCPKCQRSTSIDIGRALLNAPTDEEGRAPEPFFDRCPACGGPVAYDSNLGEWFCPRCWSTLSGPRADWLDSSLETEDSEESVTPELEGAEASEDAPYSVCPACGSEGSLIRDKNSENWICRVCGATVSDFL